MVLLTNLSELSVGDQERSQSLKTLQGLLAVLLASLLGDGHIGGLDIAGGDLLGLPDEILQKLALVLGEEHQLGLLDNIAQVLDEDFAIVGKVRRWR